MGLFDKIRQILTSEKKPRKSKAQRRTKKGRPRGTPKEKWTLYTTRGYKKMFKKACDDRGLSLSDGFELLLTGLTRKKNTKKILHKLFSDVKN